MVSKKLSILILIILLINTTGVFAQEAPLKRPSVLVTGPSEINFTQMMIEGLPYTKTIIVDPFNCVQNWMFQDFLRTYALHIIFITGLQFLTIICVLYQREITAAFDSFTKWLDSKTQKNIERNREKQQKSKPRKNKVKKE